MTIDKNITIIGAGPAGLAAAYELKRSGSKSTILEAQEAVGGLSRTYQHNDLRFDLGGHRFFTRNREVNQLWHEMLGDDLLQRNRRSHIYYRDHLFRYPIQPLNAMRGLGLTDSFRSVLSLLKLRISPIRPEVSFRDWVTNGFGKVLYDAFFKTYTEKVWGIPHDQISADWAAQRIRNLSLGKALLDAFGLKSKGSVASLIDQFDYPKYGPGQMYEAMAEQVTQGGSTIMFNSPVVKIAHRDGRIVSVTAQSEDGLQEVPTDQLISSMPLTDLVKALKPAPPDSVLEFAHGLGYRALVSVNLAIDHNPPIDDNWIYLHSPQIKAARLQLFRNWSPHMASGSEKSPIGLEYFCFEKDNFWSKNDDELVEIAAADLKQLDFMRSAGIEEAMVVRAGKAYPVYDDGYAARVAGLCKWLENISNLQCIGRAGQFRYNNMDHSILTGFLAVRRIQGQKVDPWSVNEEAEYIE